MLKKIDPLAPSDLPMPLKLIWAASLLGSVAANLFWQGTARYLLLLALFSIVVGYTLHCFRRS